MAAKFEIVGGKIVAPFFTTRSYIVDPQFKVFVVTLVVSDMITLETL